jgi:hypothetical protein
MTLVVGASLPVLGQKTPKGSSSGSVGGSAPFLNQPLIQSGARTGMVPKQRAPMVGDGTFIPADIPVRSTKGVTGFDRPGKTRIRVGGANGAPVIEKAVNITQTNTLDERTPHWSSDERFLYYAGFTAANPNRYALYRIVSDEPTDTGASTPVAMTDPADTQFDYLFPAVNANNTRIAFLRSSDGKGIDDPTKRWDLYVADLPNAGQFIDKDVLGPTNLRKLSEGRDFPNGQGGRVAFSNIGRPAWIGSNDLVFAAQLGGTGNPYHIFTVNIQTRVIFQLTDGAADERNPAVSPDGRYIAFDSNAPVSETGQSYVSFPADGTRRVRSETDPNAPTAGATATVATRNIFTMTTLGQHVRQFTNRYAGAPAVNSVEPTWASLLPNNFTNQNGQTYIIGFSSNRIPQFTPTDTAQRTIQSFAAGPPNTASIYYSFFSRNGAPDPAATLVEVAPTDINNLGSDGARRLDAANDTLTGGILNDVTKPRFFDRYPTFAPFIKVFRVGLQSNRNGSYFKDAFGAGFTPTAVNLNNILVASLIDITAPTLLRFDSTSPTGEIVHINLVTDPNRPYNGSLTSSVRSRDNGITPGANLHFTVRVEDREAGMRPENSADGGAVFLAFKNPNSKYQSTAQGGFGVEHKEYGLNTGFLYLEGQNPLNFSGVSPTNVQITNLGPEYECQVIAAQDRTTYFSHIASGGPVYLAGISDSFAYSGVANPPLVRTTPGVPQDIFLQLKPLVELNDDGTPRRDANGNTIPIRPADGQGGVLYGATWRIPQEASDWYIDVIVYDDAVNPFNANERSNWIIYDNVWGFSSAAPVSGPETDILVVVDYALGQKFFASRFGEAPNGLITGGNLQPVFFGSESYYTDRDLRLYPSEQGLSAPSTIPPGNPPTVRVWDSPPGPFGVSPQLGTGAAGFVAGSATPNVLGVESYNDEYLNSGAITADTNAGRQYRLPPTGRYSIWRILSRGPVPISLLQDYQPKITTTPADTAPVAGETQPRTIQHSTRFVVWITPFSGNLFVGPGTITDIQTQNDLEGFVTSGGRLFISGQDIGFALVGNGQSNRFYTNILKAQYVGDNVGGALGSLTPAGTAGPGGDYIGQFIQDGLSGTQSAYGQVAPPTPRPYTPPNAGGPNNATLRYTNFWAGIAVNDGANTGSGSGSYLDGILPAPTAQPPGTPPNVAADSLSQYTYTTNTGISAIIASSVPSGTSPMGTAPKYSQSRPFVPVGKVIYAACDFGSISQGWYTYSANNVTIVATLGRRTELMQNVSGVFRTGTMTGRLVDTNGAAVNDALVRVFRNSANDQQVADGVGLTDDNGNFQIVGLQPGVYSVFGYKPGFYTQHNSNITIHGGWRAASTLVLKKAGPGALSGIPGNTVNTNGGVFTQDGSTPIPNIEIQARRREPNGLYTLITVNSSDGTARIVLPDGTSTFLPRGAYLFPALLIGNYQIIANSRTTVVNGKIVPKQRDSSGRLPGVNEAYAEVRVTGGNQPEVRLGQGTTIVPDPNPTAPDPIGPTLLVKEGETAQIDFLLPSAPQQVKGKVTDQDSGQPIVGAIVTAVLKGQSTLIASGTTDANGDYTLSLANPVQGQDPTLIPGGTYIITANANGYDVNVPPSAVNNVELVVGGTLDPIITVPEIKLKKLPPGSLSGLVRRFNGLNFSTSGVAGTTVTLYSVTTVGGQDVQSPNPSYTATVTEPPQTRADGSQFNFRIDAVLPGKYNVYVAKPGLTGNPSPFVVTVTSGQEATGVNFTLEPPKIFGAGVQLISVPQDFSNIPTRSVFGLTPNGDNDGNGVVNNVDQQIYNLFNVADWTGTTYNVSPDIPLRLGKGYFVRFGSVTAPVTQGVITQGNSYTISLTNGWNLIGHPFSNQQNPSDPAADIDISSNLATYSYTAPNGTPRTDVSLQQAVADGAVQGLLYRYTGSNSGSAYVQSTLLQPWIGYWFRTFVPVQMTLRYPGAATRSVKAPGGKFRTITRAEREEIRPRAIESRNIMDWRLQIAARQGDLTDADNAIGVSPDATEGFDNKYDHEKPPMITEADSLYVAIKGNGPGGRAAGFSDNVQAAGGGTKTWEFTVETTGKGEVTLYWPNIGRLPRGIEPILVDVASGRRVAMRSGGSSFRFTPSGRAQRSFRIEVARASSMPLDILNLRTTTTRGLAGGTYRFSFTTTRAVDINAEIKTMTGRVLKRFRTRATGGVETSLVWDGRDEAGTALPPGGYMLNLTAQDERGSKVSRAVLVMTNQ